MVGINDRLGISSVAERLITPVSAVRHYFLMFLGKYGPCKGLTLTTEHQLSRLVFICWLSTRNLGKMKQYKCSESSSASKSKLNKHKAERWLFLECYFTVTVEAVKEK
ncbi:Uncharacterized protein Rs2_29363 [Raphanus sativus]|nr:Uncharacterized protein Rs2_29363 [Raphanus sativus]